MNAAEFFESNINREFERIKADIKDHAESIKLRMERLIRELDDNPEDPLVNSLGELQTTGLDLDRLCGQLATIKQIIKMWDAYKKLKEAKQ